MTFVALSVILLAITIAVLWWRKPPMLNARLDLYGVRVSVDVSQAIPDSLLIRFQPIAPERVVSRNGTEDAMPEPVLEYLDRESDEWAREARKKHAYTLRADLGSWDAAFRQLQREDGN